MDYETLTNQSAQADARLRDPRGRNAEPCSSHGGVHGTDVHMPEISTGPLH